MGFSLERGELRNLRMDGLFLDGRYSILMKSDPAATSTFHVRFPPIRDLSGLGLLPTHCRRLVNVTYVELIPSKGDDSGVAFDQLRTLERRPVRTVPLTDIVIKECLGNLGNY